MGRDIFAQLSHMFCVNRSITLPEDERANEEVCLCVLWTQSARSIKPTIDESALIGF